MGTIQQLSSRMLTFFPLLYCAASFVFEHLSLTMARNYGTVPPPQDTTAIDLSRLIARLQNILVTPDSATETKLRASSYEREKVGNVSPASGVGR